MEEKIIFRSEEDDCMATVIEALGRWRGPSEKAAAQRIADRGMPARFILDVIRGRRDEEETTGVDIDDYGR